MNLKVTHKLRYEYDKPVVLAPHTLYLYPKSYPHQQVKYYNLLVQPSPSKIVRNVDVEGNVQQILFFTGSTQILSVEAQMVLSSDEFNVFDFVLFPFETQDLPFQYNDRIYQYLIPYLHRKEVTPYIEQFARKMAADTGWKTIAFLMGLSEYINSNFTYQVRRHGDANPPETTLNSKNGTCRDYSRFFIAVCRSVGIAARFVSGYLYGNKMQEHELHAWVEVYLPGAGWRGFDPTEGRAIINNHISLGASADFDQLSPVMGAFQGSATSLLSTDVSIVPA